MKKLVIFDIDGTLIDSLPDIMYNLNYMLKEYNHSTLNREQTMKIIGNGARQLVVDAISEPLSEQQINQRFDHFCGLYASRFCEYTQVFEGIYQLLDSLKKKGYMLAVVTNKPQNATELTCEKFFNCVDFSMIIGQSEEIPCKPDPTGALKILETLGVEKQNAYFVGDGETDFLTAKNAGINGISCLWGYRSKEHLASFGATVFAEKPSDILKLLGE